MELDKVKEIEPTMTVMKAIYSRRAVRSYSKKEVEAQVINKLIDAAIQAPRAMNSQPWAFVVIQNPQVLHELSDSAKLFLSKNVHWSTRSEHVVHFLSDPSFDIFYGATTLIVICGKKEGFSSEEDCYLAGENLMLAATALGLGTCPIGFARDVLGTKEYRQKLSITDDYTPALPIVVGYAANLPPKPERKGPIVLKWWG